MPNLWEISNTSPINHWLTESLPSLDGTWDPEKMFQAELGEFQQAVQSNLLQFSKLLPVKIETLYSLLGSSLKFASVFGSVVGAIDAAKAIATAIGIVQSEGDQLRMELKDLQQKVENIFHYLEQRELQDFSDEVAQWRSEEITAEGFRWMAATTRADAALSALDTRTGELVERIELMLLPEKASIIFNRQAYMQNGVDPFRNCKPPFMSLADGSAIPDYTNPNNNLVAHIWDAYYIDLLVPFLNELLACCYVLEPGFHSTSFYRPHLAQIAKSLKTFIAKWRSSFIVANPQACIDGSGRMTNGSDPTPLGLLVGGIDPVTGISSLGLCSNFAWNFKYDNSFFASGTPDRSVATDPQAALAASWDDHRQRLMLLERACGIRKLETLQFHFEQLAVPPTASQFVVLPKARFGYPGAGGPLALAVGEMWIGEDIEIDLGLMDKWASQPGRLWKARRYRRRMTKTLVFQMARRAERSHVRLGYTLVVGGKTIELCPFQHRAPGGQTEEWFPAADITSSFTVELQGARCCQVYPFSRLQEDKFEADGVGDRVLVPIGPIEAKFEVHAHFTPQTGNDDLACTGDCQITIANLDPDMYPDSYELEVKVLEAVADGTGNKTIVADTATVCMTPSYFIVEQAYLAAYAQAIQNMVESVKQLIIKVKPKVTDVGPTNPLEHPDWTLRRLAPVSQALKYFTHVSAEHPRAAGEVLAYVQSPLMETVAPRMAAD